MVALCRVMKREGEATMGVLAQRERQPARLARWRRRFPPSPSCGTRLPVITNVKRLRRQWLSSV